MNDLLSRIIALTDPDQIRTPFGELQHLLWQAAVQAESLADMLRADENEPPISLTYHPGFSGGSRLAVEMAIENKADEIAYAFVDDLMTLAELLVAWKARLPQPE